MSSTNNNTNTDIPETMKAIVIAKLGSPAVRDVPVPKPKADELLVRVTHVSLNPTDWKHLHQVGAPNAILGCDYGGVVVSAGADAAAAGWKTGERAGGFAHGGKFPDRGTFAEYTVVKANLAYKVPEKLESEAVPTYGVGFSTAAMVLFHDLKTPYPPAKVEGDKWFLVSGGSTSVGLSLLPLLRTVGYRTIATASPHSFDLVKSYGAEHVVDYHDVPAALDEIKRITNGGVSGALECVGGDDNFKLSIGAFKPEGGRLTTLTLIPEGAEGWRDEVDVGRVLLYTVGGYSFEYIPGRPPLPALPKDNEWFASFVPHASKEFLNPHGPHPIRPNPLDVRDARGSLEKIYEGLEELRQNKVSGKKLVYQIA